MPIAAFLRFQRSRLLYAVVWTTISLASAQTRGLTPSDRAITLDEAIRLAIDHQPQLAIARSQLSASRARLTESNASYFPQLTPNVEYRSSRSSYHIGGETVTQTSDRSEASIGLRQLLFDTGRREANVRAARSSVRAAELSLQNVTQSVILNVTVAYFDVIRRRDLLKVQEATVERARTTLEATRAYAEEGTVRRIDILQAEADYGNARVQLGIARNDLRLAEVALRNAIGLPAEQSVTASDESPPWPSDAPDTRTAQDYALEALTKRPDLLRDLAYLDVDRASARVARIASGPQVQADFTAGYRIDPDRGDNQLLLATLTYPLFDGGSSRARVRAAEESVKQTQQQIELAKQDIHLAVEQAYLSREEARERIAAARSAEAAARANYEAASEGYKEGVQTVVDVITARTQLVTAETNLVQTLYDFLVADARLKRAVGVNDAALGGTRDTASGGTRK